MKNLVNQHRRLVQANLFEDSTLSTKRADELPYSMRAELQRCASQYEAFVPGQRRAITTEVI